MRLRLPDVCLLGVAAASILLFTAGYKIDEDTARHTTGTVVEIGADLTIRTDDGHEWLYGHCGVSRGDRVTVWFDTRGTDEVSDDVIVSVSPIKIGSDRVKTTVRDYLYVKEDA